MTRVEEFDLSGDALQVTAAPRQRQLQRRDRHLEVAPPICWRRLDVRLGDRQMSTVARTRANSG
jgi:hypothetical protein